MPAHEPNPIHHVVDTKTWQFLDKLIHPPVEIDLPAIPLFGYNFQLTKFMIL